MYGLLTNQSEELAMSSLTVIQPKITILDQDVNIVDGLYSLNDTHKIGGGAEKHRPTFFLRNQETKDLIAELESEFTDVRKCTSPNSQVIRVVKGGDGQTKQGTYVCKELVYRYAMWISPKFALIVIRTFDDLMNKRLENSGYQLGDLQKLSDEVDAEYAIGFSVASNGGKTLNDWKGKKSRLEAKKAAIQELMQPLLTGFDEAKKIN